MMSRLLCALVACTFCVPIASAANAQSSRSTSEKRMLPARATPDAAVALGVKGVDLTALPASFQLMLQANGASHAATFQKFSNRGPNVAVKLQGAGGQFTDFTPGGVATYLGTLDANTDGVAAAVVLPDGTVFYQVAFTDGEHWINEGGATTVRAPGAFSFNLPQFVPPPAATANGMLSSVTVGVDVPRHIFASVYQADPEIAQRMIEYSLLGANLVYMRQAGIQHRLQRVFIRADAAQDPYAPLRTNDLTCTADPHCEFLNEVDRQWSSVLPAGSEHMALVLREFDGAGLASVGTVASPRSYSSNDLSAAGDFSQVWRHEGGHNWSLNHFDGGTPEGSTINSGNALAKMSGPEAALVAAFRTANSASFNEIGPLGLPIPPHAATDSFLVPISQTSLDLDVLANDHDANGGNPTLMSVSTVSGPLGGLASVVGGHVRYQPQTQLTSSFDVLQYRIAGATGTARGFVFVTQVNFGLSYQQDFSGFANGTTDLGDGSTMNQVNAQSVSVQANALELVPDQTNRFGGFTIPMIGLEGGFSAKFRFNVSSAGTAADAFAFNFGQRAPAASGPNYHGFMRGVTVEFNTFALMGYQVFVNGVALPGGFVASSSIADGQWHNTEISWERGKLSLVVDGSTVIDKISTTGFTPNSQDGLAFSAKNIGLSQRVLIDDIDISADTVFYDGFE